MCLPISHPVCEALRTLAYADIFDYPLKAPEAWRFLISQGKTKEKDVQIALTRMSTDLKLISAEEGFYCAATSSAYCAATSSAYCAATSSAYCAATNERSEVYFLKGRKKIISIRKKREKLSQEKLKIAKRVAGWLKLIPTIKMVAVTGALATKNSDRDDDIDLLIVTSKNRLWLTRFFSALLVELVAKRRHPKDREFRNKICLNMFLDEEHLAVPKKEQDLFSAHEVCQLKPIWERGNCYQKFLKANLWSKKYLPNWKP